MLFYKSIFYILNFSIHLITQKPFTIANVLAGNHGILIMLGWM